MKRVLQAVCIAAWLMCVAVAQTAPERTNQGSQPPKQRLEVQGPPPQTPSTTQRKITAEEAQELFRSVDEILKFVSERTGLPVKTPVKRELTSREKLESYISARMAEDEDTQRLKRSGMVLKKFGLLPPNFNIETYIVQLYREQVAGYYEPRTKTVYLLDWVDPELQKPVLAHELTHALQDQNFNLLKWANWDNHNRPHSATEEIAENEDRTARQAVMEGQATLVLFDYTLAQAGRSVEDSPMMVNAMKAGMLDAPDSPIFSEAPLYLREAMTFPYRYGLDFTRVLVETRGKAAAYSGVFRNPPTDTRQVMLPTSYLNGEKVPTLKVPDFGKLFGGDFERYDLGSMGQFDVLLLLKVYASDAVSVRLAPQWRGGYYYAAQKKGASPEDIALVYVSKWADRGSAQDFAKAYADGLKKRYSSAKPIFGSGTTVSMTPDHWETEAGQVWIQQRRESVIAVESAPAEVANRILRAID